MLVATDGQVKLLDFGIAKLIEGEAAGEATALTREGGRALTPEYAAPEQVTGGPITIATDVYALGALLYLLLSGQHPAGEARRSPAALLRAIVDVEPPRLSDAARDPKTRRSLKGDLDTIVAKALKKQPGERYASVTALADDLGAISITGRSAPGRTRPPIGPPNSCAGTARPSPSPRWRLVALAVGLAGTITQARRATRQRSAGRPGGARGQRAAGLRAAPALARRSDQRPQRLPALRRRSLRQAIHRRRSSRSRGADRRAATTARPTRTAWRYSSPSAGSTRCGTRMTRRVRCSAGHTSWPARLPEPSMRAKAACALAGAVVRAGGRRARREAHPGGPERPPERADSSPWTGLSVFCAAARLRGDVGNVNAGIERAQAAQRLLTEPRLASALLQLRVSMGLAESYRLAGRNREAAAAFQKAFERLSSLGRDETERAGTLLNNWALAIETLGRPLEAERLFRRAVQIGSADGTERGVSPMLLNNLARTLRELHRLSEATHYAERACANARQARNEMVTNQSLFERARVYRERGDIARATSTISELEPRLHRMLPRGHAAFASLASEQALLAQARRDFPAAGAAADEAVAIAEASGQRVDYLPRMLLRRSSLELEMRLVQEARADAARALGIWQDSAEQGTFSCWQGRAYLALGSALQAQGQLGQARAAFASALEHLQPSLGADHPQTREARQLVASIKVTSSQ